MNALGVFHLEINSGPPDDAAFFEKKKKKSIQKRMVICSFLVGHEL